MTNCITCDIIGYMKINHSKQQTVIENELVNSYGRFTGIQTFDGRVFNAKIKKVTPHYVLFFDTNMGTEMKIAKSSIMRVNRTYA